MLIYQTIQAAALCAKLSKHEVYMPHCFPELFCLSINSKNVSVNVHPSCDILQGNVFSLLIRVFHVLLKKYCCISSDTCPNIKVL